jgi:hypothetical protein
MAHFASQELTAFFGLLSPGHIDEDSKHDPVDHAYIITLATGGDPPHLVAKQNAEVYLVAT